VAGIAGILLVIVLAVAASFAGSITCHEDVGSDRVAPNLCRSVGNENVAWMVLLGGPLAVFVLLLSGVRTRTFALVTALIVAVEGALVITWALVSHGTIHY
jgi:small-conductance mechanosensitive channel